MGAGKMELDMLKLGTKVRELRKERGLTQLQLAEAAEITEQTLCNLENGNKRHHANTIYRIAMALNISCAVLMDQHAPPDDSEDEAFITFYRERSDGNRRRIRKITQLVFEGDD